MTLYRRKSRSVYPCRRVGNRKDLTYSVEVHVDTDARELRDGIVHASKVGCLSVRALLDGQVGDQVGQRVGLDDRDNTNIWVFCESFKDSMSVGYSIICVIRTHA